MSVDLYQLLTQKQYFPIRLVTGLWSNNFFDREYLPGQYQQKRRSCASSDEISKWQYYCKEAGVRVFYTEEDVDYYFERLGRLMIKNSWMG